ncbi:CobW family GTP-binding protein [Shewanella waksmanii]|uniref:CobW family GTP-binding protein n=1 Tax=Shewanella waksmanii TaxID=213783 RepID=UPI000492142B|nr:GTP-binding protein [Shewanella waksmanii]
MIVQAIATNVITGFLGVGKTSFIQGLLASKPSNERWAVLVNEFGEVGIDGSLLGSSDNQVQIKEVPGGCLCCAAGVPLQVAITELIRRSKPDRLLIEPTGLGHPKAIIKLLMQSQLASTLKIEQSLCLVDATKVADKRYTEHDIFQQQIQIADTVLAAKADSYQSDELKQLQQLLKAWQLEANLVPLSSINADTERFASDYQPLLHGRSAQAAHLAQSVKPAAMSVLQPVSIFADTAPQQIDFDADGCFHCSNSHDGFETASWVFDVSYEFEFDALVSWIKSLSVLRLKAVLITDEGIAAFNYVDGQLSVQELDDVMDSRLEVIADSVQQWSTITAQLQAMSKRYA